MNPTLETIESLRSTHGDFTDREISEQDLESVLAASVRAANASARQAYTIVVVRDRNLQRELTGYAGSATLVYCVDCSRLERAAARLGFDPGAFENGYGRFTEFLTSAVDASLAAQTACIAARSLGIDSLFTNGIHRGDPGRVYRLLDLPGRYCFALIALVLGYADKTPAAAHSRIGDAPVVQRERYRPMDEEDCDRFIARYDEAGMGLQGTRYWSGKGYGHYLEWFFKEWCGFGGYDPSRTPGPDALAELLARRGFLESARGQA
jgi:nitroreductase